MVKKLISFVGSNDAGNEGKDGTILSALSNEKFDEAILLWNQSNNRNLNFGEIASYLKRTIKKRRLTKEVSSFELKINDVTDHNEIYSKLKEFTESLDKSEPNSYTAAISSGTPAMQVCWILLAESGDFSETNPLRLIKVADPRYSESKNIPVKLNTSLPKIISLKNENIQLKKDFLPVVHLFIETGKVFIGNIELQFAPVEFAYYRYFLEKAKEGNNMEKISGLSIPIHFLEKVYQFHEESFPVLDINREEIRKAIKSNKELGITTFRGNVTKINRKIKELINNKSVVEQFEITSQGKRGAKFYGILASQDKIIIK
jgi:hypothetical protein